MIFTFYVQNNKTVIHFNGGGHRRSTQRHNRRSKKFWGRCNLCNQRGHKFRKCPHFVVASVAATAAATGTSSKATITVGTSMEAVTTGTPMLTVTAGTETTAITSSTEIISTTTAIEVRTSEAEVKPNSYN